MSDTSHSVTLIKFCKREVGSVDKSIHLTTFRLVLLRSMYVVVVAAVNCCCSHINSHTEVRGHRTGSSHSGALAITRAKNTNKPKVNTNNKNYNTLQL